MQRFTRWLALLLLAAGAHSANADLIRLKNGGEIRGKLHSGHTRDPLVTIDTLSGGTVVVRQEQVEFTTIRSLNVEQYETRARSVPNTVDARWELAEWCRQNRLRAQRDEQLELLLTLDPEHAEAHKALGHVQENGEWMTRAQQMTARGYVQHKGKWVTAQELDLLEKSEAERAAEEEWFSKVYAWTRWAAGRNERQRQQGRAHLLEIVDPAAVAALTSHMADHEESAIRELFVNVLADIPGPKPVRPLVARSLFDDVEPVRLAAIAAIKPDQYEPAMAMYVPALLSNDNPVVNRAAMALGEIGDQRVVPALIDALITSHSYKIEVPVNDAIGVALGPGGATLADPNAISQYLPPEIEIQLRTGQLPFGAVVLPPTGIPQRTRAVRVQGQLKNTEVLAALERLTGQNLGYDERSWKLWWAAQAAAPVEFPAAG
jgi:HEAT repeat protein